ncbi:hypothetical protein SAMN05421504_104511 [Amycolatopsis xylanica]|uniref:Uncharacterized protein n=1 Tax=Amycolatopsis xylanica TaxID=589385 RepID=A0A1H3H4C6_9PSEU|nr:DUF6338 family protein [Amycolatopsis xylanica]SDY10247.1 hypothetical protein SAMN05421504_104511 [Amycolatopsis xylanica]
MPPSTLAGLVFLIAALSPGLVYHRMLARFLPRDSRSTVAEVVEMATAGALTSAIALVVVLGAGQVIPGLLSLDEAVGDPALLRPKAWSVVVSALLVLLLSLALAVGGGRLWVRVLGKKPTRIHQGLVWSGVLSAKRDGLPVFLAVEVDDGRLIEGLFRSVSVDGDPARDAIVLQRPIAVSGPGDVPRTAGEQDFVLIPRASVKAVHGKYVPLKKAKKAAEA